MSRSREMTKSKKAKKLGDRLSVSRPCKNLVTSNSMNTASSLRSTDSSRKQ